MSGISKRGVSQVLNAVMLGFVTVEACVVNPSVPQMDASAFKRNSLNVEATIMKITTNDLEEIRSAAITFLQQTQHEFRTTFIPELERGAIITAPKGVRIGIWVFEQHADRFALIRQPPVSPIMRYFGLILKRKDHRWIVESDFQEIEKLDLQE